VNTTVLYLQGKEWELSKYICIFTWFCNALIRIVIHILYLHIVTDTPGSTAHESQRTDSPEYWSPAPAPHQRSNHHQHKTRTLTHSLCPVLFALRLTCMLTSGTPIELLTCLQRLLFSSCESHLCVSVPRLQRQVSPASSKSPRFYNQQGQYHFSALSTSSITSLYIHLHCCLTLAGINKHPCLLYLPQSLLCCNTYIMICTFSISLQEAIKHR